MNERAVPVGGPVLTRPFKILLGLFALGTALLIWRFAAGLGPTTAMNDGYPWGIWIAFEVVTGTALACGGYAMAILVYLFNKGKYHPLVRPALLTSALGYSIAAFAIVIDVGRPWLIWRIPLAPVLGYKWNLNSALLEVALCVMAYVVVLWIELVPVFLDKWRDSPATWLRSTARKLTPVFEKAAIWIISLGILLPTMHQSSLGTVMLLSGPRLHGLWNTPWVPFLFLVSVVAMGYAAVVMESALAHKVFRRKPETAMLASVSRVIPPLLFLFVVVRFVDLIFRGRFGMMFTSGVYSLMFWIETALFLVPAFLLLSKTKRRNLGYLFRSALLIILVGTLYRVDVYIVAFRPGFGRIYFPSVPEMFITFGVVALEIIGYILLVKFFPILSGATPAAAER